VHVLVGEREGEKIKCWEKVGRENFSIGMKLFYFFKKNKKKRKKKRKRKRPSPFYLRAHNGFYSCFLAFFWKKNLFPFFSFFSP
jgi:hypothetical protein